MRHHNNKRKFGRTMSERNALISSLARNLIVREKMKTTLIKAKELRPFVEKLVTKAKKDTIANRRLVVVKLDGNKRDTEKLFKVIAPKYTDRAGGYTRILKLGVRKSDSAEMAQIEFV